MSAKFLATETHRPSVSYQQGRYAEGDILYRKSLSALERALGAESPRLESVLQSYARLLKRSENYSEAEKVQLRATHHDVAIADLRPAGADGLYFPALERDSRLVALLDEIIVGRLAVVDDRHNEF